MVFCDPLGRPYDPNVTATRFQRRTREAGLPVIRLHDARHTHATLLLENGESLKYVAERLGDREDTVLEIYQHVTAKTRAEAPSRLAALIDSEPQPQPPDDIAVNAAGTSGIALASHRQISAFQREAE